MAHISSSGRSVRTDGRRACVAEICIVKVSLTPIASAVLAAWPLEDLLDVLVQWNSIAQIHITVNEDGRRRNRRYFQKARGKRAFIIGGGISRVHRDPR
eukprot:scaffold204892_cov36-Prasinocladus_malaysianus.AAC.1